MALAPDIRFNMLFGQFDRILVELEDRLRQPDAGLLFGKGGKPDPKCIRKLGNLGLALTQRNTIVSKSVGLNAPESQTINKIWDPLMKSVIDAGVGIDKPVPIDPKKYGTDVPTVKSDIRLQFLMNALEAVDILTAAPECAGHIRIDHLMKNSTSKGPGALEVEAFKTGAKQWIRDYPKAKEVAAVEKEAIAAVTPTLPNPPPPYGSVTIGGMSFANPPRQGGGRRKTRRLSRGRHVRRSMSTRHRAKSHKRAMRKSQRSHR